MLGLAGEAVPAEIVVSTGHKLTLDGDGLVTSAEPCGGWNADLAKPVHIDGIGWLDVLNPHFLDGSRVNELTIIVPQQAAAAIVVGGRASVTPG